MTASGAGEVAESAASSRPMGWLARIGLTARGLVYLVVGWLAVLVGLGGRANIDQRGALTEVLAQPYGAVMLWLLTIGFAAYALWRLSEAAFGATGEGKKAGPRLRSLARGIAYVAMAFTAQSLLQGARGTQAGQQGNLAGTVMQHTGGRWIVAIVGLIVLVVGLVLVREGCPSRTSTSPTTSTMRPTIATIHRPPVCCMTVPARLPCCPACVPRAPCRSDCAVKAMAT